MARPIKDTIREYLNGAYHVGIIEDFGVDMLRDGSGARIKWIDVGDYDAGWFADPFIIDIDDSKVTLLVEEYFHSTNQGRLSRIEVSRPDYRLLSVHPILEQSTHLSFPYICRSGGDIYICPESHQRDEAALYSYDGHRCTYRHSILRGRYVDTQIVERWGGVYAFAVEIRGGGMADTRHLQVFRGDTLDGPFVRVQDLYNQRCEERGAGPIFELDGMVIRPAQICEGGYGRGVVFYRLENNDGRISQHEVGRIAADPSRRWGLCFHTFAPMGGLVAVDGFDYPVRAIGRLAPHIYRIKYHLGRLLR